MRAPRVIAILAAPLIALLLWGSISASPAGPSLPSGSGAIAARVGVAISTYVPPPPTPPPTDTPTPGRRHITVPGQIGPLKNAPDLPTATPTRRPRPGGLEQVPTNDTLALPCSNAATMVSPMPIQLAVSAGTQFQAIVTIRNTGSCPWGPGYALTFQEKESIGANPLNVDSGTVAPGATHTFILNLVAPAGGTHVGYWAMKAADGTSFGPPATIVVLATQ
jgi:hypothetical protein